MFVRKSAFAFIAVCTLLVAPMAAQAANWTITQGGTYSLNTDGITGASLGAGDAIIVNGAVNTNAVTINVDADSPALSAITVSAAVAVTIDFVNAGKTIYLGNGNNATITVSAGTLTVADTGGPGGGGFSFASNTQKTLTIDATISGAVGANTFTVGNNILTLAKTGMQLYNVSIGGANATLDVNNTATISTLTMSDTLAIDTVATLTLNNGVTVPAGKTLSLLGTGTINQIDLANNDGKLLVKNNCKITAVNVTADAEIEVNQEGDNNGALQAVSIVTVSANKTLSLNGTGSINRVILSSGAYLDVNDSVTIDTLTTTNDCTIDIADGKTLTAEVRLAGGIAYTVTLAGSGTLNQVKWESISPRLKVTGDITLNNYTVSADPKLELATGGKLTVSGGLNVGAHTLTLYGDGIIDDINLNSTTSSLAVIDSPTVTSALVTSGTGHTINVASGKTLKATVQIGGTYKVTLNGTGTVQTVQFTGKEGVLAVSANATVNKITNGGDRNGIQLVQDGVTFTFNEDLDIGSDYIFFLNGSGGGSQETVNGTFALVSSDATFWTTGADADNMTGYTIKVEANGPKMNIFYDTAPAAINMQAGVGDLVVSTTAGTIVDTTFDVNNNRLSVSGGGVLGTVRMDQRDGQFFVTGNMTVNKVETSELSLIRLSNGITLTVTDKIEIQGQKLEINCSGGNSQETIAGTIELADASSELEITGADEDNPTGMTISVTEDNALLDINIDCAPTAINLTEGDGNLRMAVASGKTVSSTVNVNNNKLTLQETGNPGTISMDQKDGELAITTNVEGANIDIGANVTINVSQDRTLDAEVNIGNNTLTLAGPGKVTKILSGSGTIIANEASLIDILTVSPGAGKTFTYSGTGQSSINLLTPLDASSESFTKTGNGTLTLLNGFSFGGASGIKLKINEGTVVDDGRETLIFGDDNEAITIASGAVYTTSSSMTFNVGGSNVNLDGAVGSTVNFTADGRCDLTLAADDDVKLLGTTNVLDGCTLGLNGPFRTQWGNVNVKTAGVLENKSGSSTMWFVPDSTILLEGNGSGTLTIDGQMPTTLINLNTTSGSGQFTINRRASESMMIEYARITNAAYNSLAGGTADSEVILTGVVDGGNTTNWFSGVTANAGDDLMVESGGTVGLTGSASGGSGQYTYSWSPTTGLDNPTSAMPNASPTSTTAYTLTVTDVIDGANVDTDSVTVTVVAPLVVDAGADQSISAGGSVVLQGAVSGGSGQYTYEWVPEDFLDDANVLQPTASPTQTLIYTLAVTDTGLNKTVSDAVTVTVGGGAGGLGCGAVGAAGLPMMLLTILGMVGIKRSHRPRP